MADFDNLKAKQKKKDGRGGARPGAGRKKGKMDPHTKMAYDAKIRFTRRAAAAADKLFNAQLSKAMGEAHLYRKVRERNDDGKILRTYFEEVTSAATIREYLDGEFGDGEPIHDDNNYYYITTKSPDNQAIVSLLDRTFGKPTETLEADITSNGERISVSDAQLTQLVRARTNRGNL